MTTSAPAWNASLRFDTEDPYVCQQMRGRIFNWLSNRRNGATGESTKEQQLDPDLMSRMNGIEIGQYKMWPIHVFAGFHLSGTKPDADPKFIDPWWRQEWGEILTWPEQRARLTYTVGLSTLLILAVAKILVATGIADGLVKVAGSAGRVVGSAATRVGLGAVPLALGRVKSWLAGKGLTSVGGIGSKGFAKLVAGADTTYAVAGYTFMFGVETEENVEGNWLHQVATKWEHSPHSLSSVTGKH